MIFNADCSALCQFVSLVAASRHVHYSALLQVLLLQRPTCHSNVLYSSNSLASLASHKCVLIDCVAVKPQTHDQQMVANNCWSTFVGRHLLANICVTHDKFVGQQNGGDGELSRRRHCCRV